MSQRESGYDRIKDDAYNTPAWVTEALLQHVSFHDLIVWEPAAGIGKMVDALRRAGINVFRSDINEHEGLDLVSSFFDADLPFDCHCIITNPPYALAREFCEHALKLTEPVRGAVAMLLRTDFDHAKSRTHLFRDCPAFAMKIVLLKRIVWFTEDNGKPKASPSFNHAWYLWNWSHKGAPTMAWSG
jgi:hypothetical protein